jgi:hypothetical protein
VRQHGPPNQPEQVKAGGDLREQKGRRNAIFLVLINWQQQQQQQKQEQREQQQRPDREAAAADAAFTLDSFHAVQKIAGRISIGAHLDSERHQHHYLARVRHIERSLIGDLECEAELRRKAEPRQPEKP